MTTSDPLLALTMGDPAGIGPEIIVRAAAAGFQGPSVVVGDVRVMRRAAAQCGLLLPVASRSTPKVALLAEHLMGILGAQGAWEALERGAP